MSKREQKEQMRIPQQLQRALEADKIHAKDYHIRQALQLLEVEHLHE